jgi:hypothetical protein
MTQRPRKQQLDPKATAKRSFVYWWYHTQHLGAAGSATRLEWAYCDGFLAGQRYERRQRCKTASTAGR